MDQITDAVKKRVAILDNIASQNNELSISVETRDSIIRALTRSIEIIQDIQAGVFIDDFLENKVQAFMLHTEMIIKDTALHNQIAAAELLQLIPVLELERAYITQYMKSEIIEKLYH